jgi:membrane protein required for colicin V production
MNLFDLISLVFIFGFCLLGTIKGFIIEISEIGGLIVSFILAMYLPLGLNIGTMKYIVSFLVYFFTISISFSILSKIVRKTPLAFFDRTLGAVVGAVKGLIVVVIIFLIVSFIPIEGPKSKLKNCVFYRLALITRIPLEDFLTEKTKGLNQFKDKIPVPEQEEIEKQKAKDKSNII